MGADPIIYCLEQVTDYNQFERMCHDLMALEGFPKIEPLGGSKDKGRDAIHVSRSDSNDVTVFAYSVREDWKNKLRQDAASVRKNGHVCRRIIFLSTGNFTPSERDAAIDEISREFGWELELYGLERLRVLLSATHPEVVGKHPHIFTPAFFPRAGGVLLAACRDYVVIDHVDADSAIATWLARRLTLEGYHAWCRGLAPIAGSSVADTVEALIRSRAFRFISVLSDGSIGDPNLSARRSVALSTDTGMLLPVLATPIDRSKLDSRVQQVEAINFIGSWAQGLASLLEILAAAGCPRSKSDPVITTRSFVEPGLLTPGKELLVSNRFEIAKMPTVIHRFIGKNPMDEATAKEVSQKWSFRRTDTKRFLSFWAPPESVKTDFRLELAGGGVWSSVAEIDGIATMNLAPELVRKSLQVKCLERGLAWCPERSLVYLREGLVPSNRLYFTKSDGTRTFVGTAGQRTYWRPGVSEPYKYQLAPVFSVERATGGKFTVLTRIRVRFTDEQGKVLGRRKGLSRRKHLCQHWWNDDWLHRIMAVMQFLSNDDKGIVMQEGDNLLEVATEPDSWEIGIRLNESAIGNVDETREDALQYGNDESEGDDDNEDA